MKGQGEAAGADGEAAVRHPEDRAQRIQEGGYTQQQIVSVDQTAFCQEKIPPRTFPAGETSMPGFEAAKDRLALL